MKNIQLWLDQEKHKVHGERLEDELPDQEYASAAKELKRKTIILIALPAISAQEKYVFIPGIIFIVVLMLYHCCIIVISFDTAMIQQ